jgi:hypothetical protein
MIKGWKAAGLGGFNFLVIALFVVLYANATYPMVGIDYRLFLSRLIDTQLHYKVNGFGIQWYTPSFGGGVPAYPNPLQMQFSLTQLLTWFTNPWNAVLISCIIYAAIGFLAAFYFMRDLLGLRPLSAILGAVFFIANGFYIERVAIGHVNFITFPLIIVPVYALLAPKLPRWLGGVIVSLTVAVLVYSGGVYILVIGVMTGFITLPMVYFLKPDLLSWKKIWPVLAWGGALSLLLCGSKLYATTAYMQNFSREVHDEYSVTWYTGLGGLIAQLSGTQLALPVLKLLGKSGLDFVVRLGNWTGTPFGFWELDSSLSPALLLLIFYGAGRVIFRRPQIEKKDLFRKLIAGVCLIVAIILAVEFSIAKGFLYTDLSKLPILKSLHADTRFASAFILPLAILGTKVFNAWSNQGKSTRRILVVFLLLDGLALIALWGYYLLPMQVQQRNLEVLAFTDTYNLISAGETFPVKTIVPEMNDYEVFTLHASNTIRHYEPLFGNDSELFHPLVHEGSVYEIDNGFYNFTNPTGYVFPLLNGTRMYERISVSDRTILDEFLNRHQPAWKLPLLQILLDWVAGLALILITCAIFIFVTMQTHIIAIFRAGHGIKRSES